MLQMAFVDEVNDALSQEQENLSLSFSWEILMYTLEQTMKHGRV